MAKATKPRRGRPSVFVGATLKTVESALKNAAKNGETMKQAILALRKRKGVFAKLSAPTAAKIAKNAKIEFRRGRPQEYDYTMVVNGRTVQTDRHGNPLVAA